VNLMWLVRGAPGDGRAGISFALRWGRNTYPREGEFINRKRWPFGASTNARASV